MQITIKAARVNAGLKQSELAKAVGVATQTVNAWENGHTEPKINQAKKICEVLGVSVEDIFFPTKSI